MEQTARRHYIDNLRWMILLVLIPYHAAMAWNVWGEPNYITLEGNKALSSLVVFFSPFFMPLLFALAGISTRYALRRRTLGEYIAERAKRLLVPLLFGTLALCPVLSYLADRFNRGYRGGFLRHYAVFFTKFTDLTGADGGFSVAQFWFLLYLFAVSLFGAAVIAAAEKLFRAKGRTLPLRLPLMLLFGLPLPLLGDGKSLAAFAYYFLIGYYILADEKTTDRLARHCLPLLGAGLAFSALDVYLFIWADTPRHALNTAAEYVGGWLMLLGLLGFARRFLDFTGPLCARMSACSFAFYTYHYIWVVLFQYLLHPLCGGSAAALFFATVLPAYIATFLCCAVNARVPLLCLLTGTKYRREG